MSLPREASREARFNMAMGVSTGHSRRCSCINLAIDTLAGDFLCTPDLGCDTWEFSPDVSTQCEKVMTFTTEQNHVSNASVALEIDWRRRVGIIAERGLPPLPPRAKTETRAEQYRMAGELALEIDWRRRMGIIARRGLPPLPPRAKTETRAEQCRMAGECLCGAGGGKLRLFCNALMRLIKSQCLVGSRSRTTFENGSVVLALILRNLPRNCGGLAASDCAPPDFCEQTEAVTWLRIGLMNFSPYKPPFQILKLSAKPRAVSCVIALRATGRFVSAHPFFASMRMDWFGRLYTVLSSEYPLAEVQPREVWVTSVTKPVLFWTACGKLTHLRRVEDEEEATLRSNQFPVRAIRWWTLLLIWRSRRFVCYSLQQSA